VTSDDAGSSRNAPAKECRHPIPRHLVLTLHRLGVFRELGTSLKTTNALESIHARVESRVAKVDHWKNSEQKQRWLATALLDIEPRLHRIKNFRALPLLRAALTRQIEGLKKSAA
jgi:transposase-like protein